jgi:hypothetical protein
MSGRTDLGGRTSMSGRTHFGGRTSMSGRTDLSRSLALDRLLLVVLAVRTLCGAELGELASLLRPRTTVLWHHTSERRWPRALEPRLALLLLRDRLLGDRLLLDGLVLVVGDLHGHDGVVVPADRGDRQHPVRRHPVRRSVDRGQLRWRGGDRRPGIDLGTLRRTHAGDQQRPHQGGRHTAAHHTRAAPGGAGGRADSFEMRGCHVRIDIVSAEGPQAPLELRFVVHHLLQRTGGCRGYG